MKALKTIILSLSLIVALTSCSYASNDPTSSINEYVAYDSVIPDDKAPIAIKATLDIVAAANPKSDEEPEDNIREAFKTVKGILAKPTIGMNINANGSWTFVPYDQLSDRQKAIVDKWRKDGR